jgi:biopolymer transport protein ExbB
MTAIGLLVAVPAVLAFNWLQSRNRRIAAMMTDFSNDLLAFIGSDGQVKPALSAAPAGKPAPAAKPATTGGGVKPATK